MKIKKFSQINNALSYSHFEWDKINPPTFVDKDGVIQPRDTSFVKSNIIYAENGNGKSKLVNILKALDINSSAINKHHDRIVDPQEIKVVLDGGVADIKFNTNWNREDLKGKFLFFDKYFIDNSVHSTGPDHNDTAQRKQQRGRDIVYLGNFAEYNSEIDRINSLKTLILEKSKFFFETEKAKISGILSTASLQPETLIVKRQYIETLNVDDLIPKKELLTNTEAELVKVQVSLKDKSKISALKTLQEVIGTLSLKIKSKDGNEQMIDPTAEFAFTVGRGVQATLHKINHKKEFIKLGLDFVDDKTSSCPFCEQNIRPNDLLPVVKDYQEIFDKAFSEEEKNIRFTLNTYKSLLEKLRDMQPVQINESALNELRSFTTPTSDLPSFGLTEEQKLIVQTEIDLVITKENKILDKVEGSNIEVIRTIIDSINVQIAAYNSIIKVINTQIVQLKSDSSDGKLDTKRIQLEEIVSKLKEDVFLIGNRDIFLIYFKAVDENKRNIKLAQTLERLYQAMKEKIVEEFNTFVTVYFELIKGFVKEISPSMKILDISGQATYDRRNPRDPALCGFRIEYNNQDCTGSLSEGERQVIALAFFFARLSKEVDKDKIVVLDDPITSFDAGKRKSTAELIKKQAQDYSQLFIFTCDPLFREYCLKQVPSNRNFYYILKTAGSSAIHYVPARRETIYQSFEDEFRGIDSVLGTNENVVIYGQKLRFCLETKIKEDYFGYSEDKLSNMIEQVAGKGKIKFEKLIDNKDIILEIYSYCNTGGLAHYPKDGSTSWNELKDKVKQYLALNL